MLATLIRKELLTNLLTYRLTVALVFTIVLSALTTVIGSLDYSRNMEGYRDALRQDRERMASVTTYEELRPRIIVPPTPLAIFARGLYGLAPLTTEIHVDDYSRGLNDLGTQRDTPYMKVLAQIDFVTVVAILLSFLAVVLGFDGICGERERGTLKQLLTNPVPRAQVVIAKLVGGIVSLWVPLTIAFVTCLLIVLANDDVILSGDDWIRLLLLYGLTALFLAQIFSLSLAVSAFTHDADTSLIICLFAWLVGGVGYISALPSFSRYAHEEIPHQVYVEENDRIWGEWYEQRNEWERDHPPPDNMYWHGIERDGRMRYYHPRVYEWLQQRSAVFIPKRIENADRRYQARFHTWDPLAQEAYSVDRWSILSPFTNFQVLAHQLARTTLDDNYYGGHAAREYRQTWLQWMRGKGAFSSRRWHTDDPLDQEPEVPDPESLRPDMLEDGSPYLRQRDAWVDEQERLAVDDDRRQLDITDMPKFSGRWQRSLGDSFLQMVPGLAVLVLTLGAALLLTMTRFLRYDPR